MLPQAWYYNMASKKMVCPCLKVTKDDIINAVEQGASSFKDVKKQTRIVSKCGKCKDRVKCFVREVFVEKGLLPEEEKKEKTKKKKKKKKKKKAVNDSGNICISCENGSGDCPLQNENTGKSKEDKKPVQEKKNKAKKNKVKNKKDKKNKDKKKSKKGKNTSSI